MSQNLMTTARGNSKGLALTSLLMCAVGAVTNVWAGLTLERPGEILVIVTWFSTICGLVGIFFVANSVYDSRKKGYPNSVLRDKVYMRSLLAIMLVNTIACVIFIVGWYFTSKNVTVGKVVFNCVPIIVNLGAIFILTPIQDKERQADKV